MSRAGQTTVIYLRDRAPTVTVDIAPARPASSRESLTLFYATWVDGSRFVTPDSRCSRAHPGQHRAVLLDYVHTNGGELLRSTGNAISARFDTPAAAVQAAIHAQLALESLNHEYSEHAAPVKARIGVHLGHISRATGELCGDELDVAPRLAELAVPDGICVSKPVYDAVRNDWQIACRHLGLLPAINLPRKVRAYLLKPAGITLRDKFHYSMVKSLHCLRHKLSG